MNTPAEEGMQSGGRLFDVIGQAPIITVQLVALAGDCVVYGFQGKVMGKLKGKE